MVSKFNGGALTMSNEYQPKTGERCSCRRGIERDNCPQCEGTGMRIDFRAIRRRSESHSEAHARLYGKPAEFGHKSEEKS